MKIGIIGDLHFGIDKKNAQITNAIVKGQDAAIESIIVDFEIRGIDTIVFAGDIFENRRFVASEVLDKVYRLFKVRLAKFQCYVIAGNHDILYDNSSDVCQLRFLENLPNVHLYIDVVGSETIGDKRWFFVPWIQEDKVDRVNSWLIKSSRGNIDKNVIVGHFDMIGARMEAKTVSTGGFDPKRFLNAAKLTISGHYHCRSEISDGDSLICYVGTPYQLSFGHVGIPAGYHIYDSDSGELEFIENSVSPTFVDVYDDQLDKLGDLSNCFVRYYVQNTRTYDEAATLKGILASHNPIHISTLSYGDEPDTNGNDDDSDLSNVTYDEAREIMNTDSVGMATMFLQRHPEILPTLLSGKDSLETTIEYIKEYNSKIK